jgi:putative phage-type endonuclease
MSIASGTTITAANHREWLMARAETLGASEAASVLGVGYDSALTVYLRKLGLMGPPTENLAMKLGKMFEPIVASLYRDETGCDFAAEQLFLRSTVHPWLSATLDYVRSDGKPLEIKTVGSRSAHLWGESGSDEVPAFCVVQTHQQMIVSGTEAVDVAALIGGQELRLYTVHRDDDITARIVDSTREFMDRVQRRDPPPIDPSRDGAALARLWPRAEGEVELGPVGELLVEQWEAHGRAIRENEAARDRAKTELLYHLGEAASARLADGRLLTRRVVSVEGKQVVRNPYEYVDLRIRNPRR